MTDKVGSGCGSARCRWLFVSGGDPGIFSSLTVDDRGRLTVQYTPYVSGSAEITVEVTDAAAGAGRLIIRAVLPDLPGPSLTSSPMTLNRQTGLWEQRITVRNTAQRAIGGFELRVAGLPAEVNLYNASGSEGSTAIAGYYRPILPDASVTLVLEYYSRTRTANFVPQLTALPALPREPAIAMPGALSVSVIRRLDSGGTLIEFSSEPGRTYVVQYSDDAHSWFSIATRIRAAGTRVQWIDRGPPSTDQPPPATGSRFYRVQQTAP